MVLRNRKNVFIVLSAGILFLSPPGHSHAQGPAEAMVSQESIEGKNAGSASSEAVSPSRKPEPSSSRELVRRAREAAGANDLEKVLAITSQCKDMYALDARELQKKLANFPPRGEEEKYQILNDVATCLFIKGEALMRAGRTEEAILAFQEVLDEYKWAQSWDPRGWYWSVAEKSQASIDVLTGKEEKEISEEELKGVTRTRPRLFTKGAEEVIDYTKYGEFVNAGTTEYKYVIKDMKGLSDAAGEGIYPNSSAIYQNPRYKEVRKEGRLKDNYWDYVNSHDQEAAYFKWVTAPEPGGVRLFYLGLIFEKSEMYTEALKAYHALVVHFPKTIAWTYWQTPWYPAQAAIAKIRHIIRIHPELELIEKGMKIQVKNGFDNDPANDIILTSPGKIVKKGLIGRAKDSLGLDHTVPLGKAVKKTGQGTVHLAQYENGHWQMLVNNQPYVIKGITYAPTKIGESPDEGTLANWMDADHNANGKIDGPFESFVDVNKNNKRDEDEPIVGDFQLMKEMGVNTIRIYHHPLTPNKALLRKMFKDYGIRVILGDFLGKYTLGSGASWFEGTDYENPEHKKNMLASVKQMVMEYKDEPFILLWLLGNENNYGVANNADKNPEAYFKFVDEAARMIKSLDPNHPVAVNNGDTLFLDVFAKYAPHVDIFSANVYRGDYGFGAFWEQVFDASGKPAFIAEYGCPAYAQHLTLEEGAKAQADYHKGNWLDIQENMAGDSRGTGNALGGVAFEWLDEWWKSYEPFRHDRKSDAIGPFPGGYYFEEWFGVISQGDGSQSPFLRQPRESYFVYQNELWKESTEDKRKDPRRD